MADAMRMGILLSFFLSAIAFAGPQQALPRRLVLALDGISYRDVARLQSQGKFKMFYPVSRSISTFPSISDTAWADIFRTEAPEGYQRFHYSVSANKIIGGALTDVGNPLEYEKKMHIAFESKLHHVHSYMSAKKTARDEVNEIVEDVMKSKAEIFYAYMLSTDTLQHTNGNVDELLTLLDKKITELSAKYEKITGRKLEIAVLSDHGNNHVQGKRVPIKEWLGKNGFNFSSTIKNANDVAFTCAGILSAVAVYAKEEKTEQLVTTLLRLEGIDIVTNTVKGDANVVVVRSTSGGEAAIHRRPGTSDYAYEMRKGDPLGYAAAAEQLRSEGKMDGEGYAPAAAWLEKTSMLHYPAALERIYRGHHVITMNPARILVSLKDGYENANGFVKWLTHFKKRGGTHGALAENDSNGILMTNFKPTQDTTTNHVGDILDFPSMDDYKHHEKGGGVVDARSSGDYLFATNEAYVSFWDPAAMALQAAGVATLYQFIIKKDGFLFFNPRIKRDTMAAGVLASSPDQTEFRIPLSKIVGTTKLKPGTYILKVYAQRIDAKTKRRKGESKLFMDRFYVNKAGQLTGG